MLFRELNRGKCKTYLVACERTKKAALIDPLKDKVERYLAALAVRAAASPIEPEVSRS